MTTWLVSDTHFFHQNLINYGIRKYYVDADDMNYYILNEWNSLVRPEDNVIHLGDFCCGDDFESIEELCQKVNGKVTLCLGNHDTFKKVQIYSKYFRVCSSLQIGDMLFSHVPVHESFLNENSQRSNCINARFNIHGHDHNGRDLGCRYFNVCWDYLEHQSWFMNHFISSEELKERLIERVRNEI